MNGTLFLRMAVALPCLALLFAASCKLAATDSALLENYSGNDLYGEEEEGDMGTWAVNPASKRGLCYNHLNRAEVESLCSIESKDGNSFYWVYNWSTEPSAMEDELFTEYGISFIPMQWGLSTEESLKKLRAYYATHKDCKYLLGYNEPNLGGSVGGSAITPEQAAADWPKLEAIAQEFDLELVSPALQYSGEKLSDGVVYDTPQKWMDAFIAAYKSKWNKEPRYDYLALHCYMNWPVAQEGYLKAHYELYGKKIWLTEFCAWEYNNGGQNESMAAQRASLKEKVAFMDGSAIVARYAWFMSHGETTRIPFNSVFTADNGTKNGNGSLTSLGKAYLRH